MNELTKNLPTKKNVPDGGRGGGYFFRQIGSITNEATSLIKMTKRESLFTLFLILFCPFSVMKQIYNSFNFIRSGQVLLF
jgi:hypothetical protein